MRLEGLVVEAARRLDALPSLALQRDVLAEGRAFVTRPVELAVTLDAREAFVERARASLSEAFLVARAPGHRVVGWLEVDVLPLARLAHVGRLAMMVGAAFRGAGVGAALLDTAVDRARTGGVLRKITLAVMADNEAAVRLYTSRGFVVEGRRIGEVRMEDGTVRDDLLMALPLA